MTALPNKIVTVDGQDFDLNGLPISLRGTTAYKDVFFGSAGYQHDHEVYVAIAGLNEDEARIAGKSTFMFHLAKFDDPRAAAYVAMKFNEDREANVLKLRGVKTSEWCCEVPKFEYEAIDTPANVARRHAMKTKMTTHSRTRAIRVVAAHVHADKPATDVATQIWGNNVFIDLAKKFGKETVLTARKYLNVNEFALRFGLKLI